MIQLTREECEEMAREVLWRFKVRNHKLLEQLTKDIQKTGIAPSIKIYWDSKTEDLKYTVLS